MVNEIIDSAASVATRQKRLAESPVSPVLAQDRLLPLLLGAIVAVGLQTGQLQRFFVAAHDQRARHKAILLCYRTEALVIEVIGHPVYAHLFERLLRRRNLFRFKAAQNDPKPVGPNVLGGVRRPGPPEVTQGHVMMLQATLWSMEDGEVLHSPGVPVFEAAVADSLRLDLPAPANGPQCVVRG